VNALARIFDVKRVEVEEAKRTVPLSEVMEQAKAAGPTRGFKKALEKELPRMGLIAEVKKASPSQGLIRSDFDPAEIALSYERAGAHALSVLTDEKHFQGSKGNLKLARAATALPALRKDFLYDPYQVYEARAWGADAILLIVASLEPAQITELRGLARELGMDSLVEVHTEDEAQIAIELGCDLIGVNNRDLATFKTDLNASDRILPMISSDAFAISESGLETLEDIVRVQDEGARAVLIGTTFCAAPDIEAKVEEVMGW
jgi:indole-3-glycerol phosphate synthase